MSRPLYAYAYADVPFDDAISVLAHDPAGLLQTATDASAAKGAAIVANLRAEVVGVEVGRDVVIEVGEFDPVELLRCVLPLTWRAAHGHLLFPTVDASLEIAALSIDPPMVQVTLSGDYEPPLGPLGEVLDRIFDRRLAEAVIHRFVGEVAERLEVLTRQPSPAAEDDVPAGQAASFSRA